MTEQPAEPAPEPPAEPFTLAVSAALAGDGLHLEATTNLPDDALITVFVTRAYHIAAKEGVPSAILGNGGFRVTGGKLSAVIPLEEDRLVGWTDPNYTIDTVDSGVKVCAQFRTGHEVSGTPIQLAAVRDVVGTVGEALENSPQKHVRGTLTKAPVTWLQVEARADGASPVLAQVASVQGSRPASERLEGFCPA